MLHIVIQAAKWYFKPATMFSIAFLLLCIDRMLIDGFIK